MTTIKVFELINKNTRYETIAIYSADIALKKIEQAIKNNEKYVYFGEHEIKAQSLRYKTFLNSGLECVTVTCELKGQYMALQRNIGSTGSYHFNLYAIKDGKVNLMTKDHILPKSKGGKDTLNNMQTMCTHCNFEKGNKLI